MTLEECEQVSQAQVREFFKACTAKRKAKKLEPQLVDPTKLKFFMGMKKDVKKKLLLNYDRPLLKSWRKKNRGKSSFGRTIPQLG